MGYFIFVGEEFSSGRPSSSNRENEFDSGPPASNAETPVVVLQGIGLKCGARVIIGVLPVS